MKMDHGDVDMGQRHVVREVQHPHLRSSESPVGSRGSTKEAHRVILGTRPPDTALSSAPGRPRPARSPPRRSRQGGAPRPTDDALHPDACEVRRASTRSCPHPPRAAVGGVDVQHPAARRAPGTRRPGRRADQRLDDRKVREADRCNHRRAPCQHGVTQRPGAGPRPRGPVRPRRHVRGSGQRAVIQARDEASRAGDDASTRRAHPSATAHAGECAIAVRAVRIDATHLTRSEIRAQRPPHRAHGERDETRL